MDLVCFVVHFICYFMYFIRLFPERVAFLLLRRAAALQLFSLLFLFVSAHSPLSLCTYFASLLRGFIFYVLRICSFCVDVCMLLLSVGVVYYVVVVVFYRF